MRPPRIVVTSGEPAGIGPDVCIELAALRLEAELVVAADLALLQDCAARLGRRVALLPYEPGLEPQPQRGGTLRVLHHPCAAPVVAGRLDPGNASYVLGLLDRACDGCLAGEFAAMVTAPVQKSVITESGVPFSGHTEYLATRSGAALPVMLLAHGNLRVALVTTHLPLLQVPAAISRERVLATLRILHTDLGRLFGLARPRIAVLGLNPHAGESGHLGREEIDTIEPALAIARREGIDARGPMPADTAFTPRALAGVDAVLAMYHDQGLPVIKHASFGETVNITLGLPIVRTSVDHGTALDLARSGRADAGSLRAAVALAVEIAGRSGADARP